MSELERRLCHLADRLAACYRAIAAIDASLEYPDDIVLFHKACWCTALALAAAQGQ